MDRVEPPTLKALEAPEPSELSRLSAEMLQSPESAPHERHDCLHCSIDELLQLAGRDPHEELVELLSCAGERIALMTAQGGDKHDILGQSVSALNHAASHYFVKLVRGGGEGHAK